MDNNKVSLYRVVLKSNPEEAFYFGSLTAIFDVFSPDDIGCKIENLWNKKLSVPGSVWKGYRATVSSHKLIRKKRGGYKK